MPVIIVFGILFGTLLTFAVLIATFVSVAFLDAHCAEPELTEVQARALFRRVANQRIDPADCESPTIAQLVRRGHLEEFLDPSPRRAVQ